MNMLVPWRLLLRNLIIGLLGVINPLLLMWKKFLKSCFTGEINDFFSRYKDSKNPVEREFAKKRIFTLYLGDGACKISVKVPKEYDENGKIYIKDLITEKEMMYLLYSQIDLLLNMSFKIKKK